MVWLTKSKSYPSDIIDVQNQKKANLRGHHNYKGQSFEYFISAYEKAQTYNDNLE